MSPRNTPRPLMILLSILCLCAWGCGSSGGKDDSTTVTTPSYTLKPNATYTFYASGVTQFEITHTGTGDYAFDLIKSDSGPWLFLARGTGNVDVVHETDLPAGDYFLNVSASGSWEVNIYTDTGD